jgi:L-alanine-DL-glutamate epimerase-like enolase superfamily enzyme
MVTNVPEIIDGRMTTPSGPGWGVDIVEEVLHAHPLA